jgi:hypothetical protein
MVVACTFAWTSVKYGASGMLAVESPMLLVFAFLARC